MQVRDLPDRHVLMSRGLTEGTREMSAYLPVSTHLPPLHACMVTHHMAITLVGAEDLVHKTLRPCA